MDVKKAERKGTKIKDDQGSPRGVLEWDSSSSSSSSSSRTEPAQGQNQKERGGGKEAAGLQWKTVVNSIKKKSLRRYFSVVVPLLGSSCDLMSSKNLSRRLAKIQQQASDVVGADDHGQKASWRSFEYSDLAAATNNFSSENLVGKGGHAEVYRGCLADGRVVAVKRLVNNEKEEEDRIGDFLSELGIIAHINHPNTAQLIGFSIDAGLLLVLKFSPHGSLSNALFGPEQCLDWKTRYKVCLGIAEGLQYLHNDCPKRIIHRDIKASNILLTEDNEAQISDFGLAKWLPENWSHHVVHPIEGTFGYLAPEYFMHGIVDEKTDVFAYGVLLLEIITGRRAVDSSRQSLAMWAKPLLEANLVADLVDPRLGDAYDVTQVKHVMLTASICIHHVAQNRPNMEQVVQLLRGEAGLMDLQQKSHWTRTMILDACDLQDYTWSRYLSDLNRHKQLVME